MIDEEEKFIAFGYDVLKTLAYDFVSNDDREKYFKTRIKYLYKNKVKNGVQS
jgi:hypothetical protein